MSELEAVPHSREPEKEDPSEEEEKQLLDKLIFNAVEKIKDDSSETGRKIKEQISIQLRVWIKENRRFNRSREATESGNQLEFIFPPDTVKA